MENQNHNTISSELPDTETSEVTTDTSLPTFTACVSESWDFIRARFDVFLFTLIASIPSVFLSIATGLNENFFVENSWLGLGLVFLSIAIAPVIYLVVLFTALYHSDRPTLTAAGQFVWRNFFAYAWLFVLTGLAMLGGMVLFVIPAIIVSVFLIFSGPIFMAEQGRGFPVLLRSHALVRDYWWGIALRFLGVSFLWGFISGILSIFGVIGIVASSVVQVISVLSVLYVTSLLYRSRVAATAHQSLTTPRPALYYGLIAFGCLGIVVLIALLGFAVALMINGFGA